MADVVVLGSGFAGMASAARLAKLGHQVTVIEAAEEIGGSLRPVSADGFTWDVANTTTLPAVIRDLFRKSGRPAERELDLVAVDPITRHRFEDGSTLDLPGGSRAAQIDALDRDLGMGAGERWAQYVDSLTDVWELLRKDFYEQPWSPEHADPATHRLLTSRTTLLRAVHKQFREQRLRALGVHHALIAGHDPRNVPAWFGMWHYLDRNFGRWRVEGGMGALRSALIDRLETRGVQVLTRTRALDLVVESGQVRAVRLGSGVGTTDIRADHVVIACDPRQLPATAAYVERTMPAIPPAVAHVGLVGDLPELPAEVIFHGDPMLIVRTGGQAPEGGQAWTLLGRGRLAEDIVTALHRKGVKIRDHVETRVDRSPLELVTEWHGSPAGVLWQGRKTWQRSLPTRTPIRGVYAAGAHAATGAGLPAAGLSASLVAQAIGPA